MKIRVKYTIRTDVAGWSAILNVSVALRGDMTGDTDRCTTVGYTRRELTNVASLMATCQAKFVVLAVDCNVLVVPLGQPLDRCLNRLHATLDTHLLRAEVAVAASTIPVTRERLRVERNLDTPLLRNANEKVASHPKMVTHLDTLARTNLELPLRRHDFCIDARNVDSGIQARAVVRFDQISCEHLASTCEMTPCLTKTIFRVFPE